jgi:dipeptidyl aminopeptidase/acylaminoacyl peptidase
VEKKMKWLFVLMLVCLLTACAPSVVSPSLTVTALLPPVALFTARATVSPYPKPTRAATLTPEPTAAALMTLTPSQYAPYTIAALRFRQYGGGEAQDKGIWGETVSFARHSISYQSDRLNISGFMNIPSPSDKKYPVIIAIHGYDNPDQYDTLDYTTDAADSLASQGYIVIHPNLRNYRPSETGDAFFGVGYAIDVLNLIGIVKQNAGKPGLFEQADASRIGIWSHSMGGNIALKVAVVSPDIKAIFLYAPMSGDEQKNAKFYNTFIGSKEYQKEPPPSAQDFAAMSPATYYSGIRAAIQLHHGTGDSVIPVAWAEETCQGLKDAGVNVECYYYAGADHTFLSRYNEQFVPRMYDFFAKYLKK